MAKICVPTAFGVRMCFKCPQCIQHFHDPDRAVEWKMKCSDICGNNAMGGYAGIATAIAMAVEYQKEMTPHGHGLVAVSNVYSHNTLPQIASKLEENICDARHGAQYCVR